MSEAWRRAQRFVRYAIFALAAGVDCIALSFAVASLAFAGSQPPSHVPMLFGDAIADAPARLVADLRARAVMMNSMHGMTAATISAARPAAPVVAISCDQQTCRRMSLMWGVIAHYVASVGAENPNQIARRVAREPRLASDGGLVVMVRGFNADPAIN